MRKHNRAMARRWEGSPHLAHQLANSKPFQLAANSLLRGMMQGIYGPKPTVKKESLWDKFKNIGRSFKAEVLA